MARGTGTIGLRQYNLYKMKEMTLIDGLDAKNNRPFNNIGSFETSALIDRRTSTLVTAGTNGLLYIIKLNPEFDYAAGVYQQSPTQVVLRTRAKGEKDASTAVEASVAMYDRYVYYADMGGYLRCVDNNSMAVAWAVALGDSVESTPALDWHGTDGLDLYTATELSLRKKGEAEIKCFDALSGEERWSTGIGVQKDKKGKTIAGFRASPVIGQNGLSEYIYYTVNNLNDAGREILNLGGDVDNAVIALRKEDGRIVWSFGLSGRGYSSPVAVYDEKGNGAIIQCAGDGSIVMLDGINGKEKANYQIDGTIEASPAVYNNILVIATTEKNKNNIYGIRIQ
ncbi:MAG: PQQ-binding-like beta-propeller repeat protein [Clostridia bacterium]|nr:PQQ-binding-like beta-propeller repeat protein [Clostridia bacterium]